MGTSTDAILLYGMQVTGDDKGALEFRDIHSFNKNMLSSIGVSIERHCSGECPEYTIAIKDSILEASRGYPQEVNKNTESARTLWDSNIETACKIIGIDYKKPKWWLQSMVY